MKALEYFIDTVQLKSFAEVARLHGVDPSGVSRLISALEAEIGVRLFNRSTRSLTLTEAGDLYRTKIEPLLEELRDAAEQTKALKDEPKGLLRLTTSVAFGQECIVPLLPKFQSEQPNISIELLSTDENLNLIENKIDLAIRLSPSLDGDLIATKLMSTRYHVVASPSYCARFGLLNSPQDLAARSCLLFTYPSFRSKWIFMNAEQNIEEVDVQGRYFFSNALALRTALKNGMGPGLLANWMIEKDISNRTLIDLFPNYRVSATNFDTGAWALYPSRAYLPKKVRVMIDFLKREINKSRNGLTIT